MIDGLTGTIIVREVRMSAIEQSPLPLSRQTTEMLSSHVKWEQNREYANRLARKFNLAGESSAAKFASALELKAVDALDDVEFDRFSQELTNAGVLWLIESRCKKPLDVEVFTQGSRYCFKDYLKDYLGENSFYYDSNSGRTVSFNDSLGFFEERKALDGQLDEEELNSEVLKLVLESLPARERPLIMRILRGSQSFVDKTEEAVDSFGQPPKNSPSSGNSTPMDGAFFRGCSSGNVSAVIRRF